MLKNQGNWRKTILGIGTFLEVNILNVPFLEGKLDQGRRCPRDKIILFFQLYH